MLQGLKNKTKQNTGQSEVPMWQPVSSLHGLHKARGATCRVSTCLLEKPQVPALAQKGKDLSTAPASIFTSVLNGQKVKQHQVLHWAGQQQVQN